MTKNNSPDLGFNWSINPYQGCEHGCVYCYARNTHEYWGYSPGKDFERKILVKQNAAQLLDSAFRKKNWKPEMIMFSGNTDCYQPAERRFGITRQMLEIFLKFRHPIGIITKNALILRDLDILKQLNDLNLLRLTLSITSLEEETRRKMEPRTSSVGQRLKALQILTEAGIKVNVNMAPIIPGINSHEIFDLIKAVSELGAHSAMYIMVRLNGQIADIFDNWVSRAFPERADKVRNLIKEVHGGNLNESRWKIRMKGEGNIADQVRDMFQLACKTHLNNEKLQPINLSAFRNQQPEQYSIFDE
jgi:DNA repair photolyase